MFEVGKTKGLTDLVVGSFHAHEMPVNLNQIRPLNKVIDQKTVKQELGLRAAAHKKIKPILDKMWAEMNKPPKAREEKPGVENSGKRSEIMSLPSLVGSFSLPPSGSGFTGDFIPKKDKPQ